MVWYKKYWGKIVNYKYDEYVDLWQSSILDYQLQYEDWQIFILMDLKRKEGDHRVACFVPAGS